jgi:hypothetical protein
LVFDKDHGAPFWDFVSYCRVEGCPLFDDCPHNKSRGVKCGLGIEYMGRIQSIVMGNADRLSAGQMFRIGTGLVPLYKLFFKLKMRELEIEDPVRKDGSVDPIYDAISRYADKIERVWRSTGLHDADVAGALGGDLNYYESMAEDAS